MVIRCNPDEGGDVITAADGQSVKSVEELSDYFMTRQVGDKVTLSVVRDNQNLNIQVTLDSLTGIDEIIPRTIPEPDFPLPWGGRFHRIIPTPEY
jgi:hypothetical protein